MMALLAPRLSHFTICQELTVFTSGECLLPEPNVRYNTFVMESGLALKLQLNSIRPA